MPPAGSARPRVRGGGGQVIATDFAYYRPETADEAIRVYREVTARGGRCLWYGGGTEILSMARLDQVQADAVVDIKAIPECRILQRRRDRLCIGAGVTLAELGEADLWPLMSRAAGRVADHTVRCKITLGGHLAGRIQYREAALPLMLVDAEALIAGERGWRHVPLPQVFPHERAELALPDGEFLAQVTVACDDLYLPYSCVKRTRIDWVDYPLMTLAAVRKSGRVRVAVSGVCDFPFRSAEMEEALNDPAMPSLAARAEAAAGKVPGPVVNDLHGSPEYRSFVLRNALESALSALP